MEPSWIEVAFPLPLDRTFHYGPLSPESWVLSAELKGSNSGLRTQDSGLDVIGRRVLAPFGKKKLIGYVVATISQKPPFPTKPISAWLDEEPLLDPSLMELGHWLAKTYLCSLGEALACIVPKQLAAPKRPLHREASSAFVGSQEKLQLTSDQKRVFQRFSAAIEQQRFESFLLRGITDSGKTEVYLRTIDQTLEQGRQAIFLLPEIALTPPFIQRLQKRYSPAQVGVWHSGLSAIDRYLCWRRAQKGELSVMCGARSAVFAPFPRLGVIVMDEEHEPSYKQEDRPRYHTRDVALWRAERAHAAFIMGSATPSLESYWKAKQGHYTLVELTSRIEQRRLPPVTLIDRRYKKMEEPGKEKLRKRRGIFQNIFSEPLKLAIEQRLARREQVLLFVNRRGFTPFLRCGVCGWVARCTRCSTTLIMHLPAVHAALVSGRQGVMPTPADALLQCHVCGHEEAVPIQCPNCKSMKLRNYGVGTQRVEEEIKHLFPFVKLARLDRDVASVRHAYERIYHAFANGELDMLIGTQMIAKGFDFPKVTLVGVVDADVTLHLPDFRAAERTFQLIAQVAGRTGRGISGGKALVQTHYPEHYALQAAQAHDYLRFYGEEITYREALRYPPFCRLIHIVLRTSKEPVVQNAAEILADKIRALNTTVEVLGPGPAPYSRMRGQFRYQIVLRGAEESSLPVLEFLRHYKPPKAFMTIDVDPADLL